MDSKHNNDDDEEQEEEQVVVVVAVTYVNHAQLQFSHKLSIRGSFINTSLVFVRLFVCVFVCATRKCCLVSEYWQALSFREEGGGGVGIEIEGCIVPTTKLTEVL